MAFYFEKFEGRTPPAPVPYSIGREMLWQFLATMNLSLGGWYLHWRWTDSLNWDALWFAIPLVVAESCAYIGLVLFTINLWRTKDYEQKPPPVSILDCVAAGGATERPIRVDVFFPTYDEDPELVRLSIADAKRITYPHAIDIRIHVLDDGHREAMRQVAEAEDVNYIARTGNVGFKAGNLRNAMEQTDGDFILICDADTRPFPTILEHTFGYFRDPDVAWVQTPQWFFDLPEGRRLPDWLAARLGSRARRFGDLVERLVGPVSVGTDPFVNDPQMFYDVLQRRRNWANASFCCGTGSIHRREAVMEVALKGWAAQINRNAQQGDDDAVREAVFNTEFTPYKFHVSEDIYTSIMLHSDQDRCWKSVMHPEVESKMLSPQDLQTWIVQRFKYAGGTLDIARNDNPVLQPGMSFWQRAMYASTIWSYLAGLWNVVFLLSPIIFLFSTIAPVDAYTSDFFIHIIPFLVLNELATMVGTWGIPGWRSKSNFLGFFPINLKAIWTVVKGEQIKFPITPKERADGTYPQLVIPQIAIVALTLAGIAYAWIDVLAIGNHQLMGVIANTFWGLNNVLALSGMIFAAFWSPEQDEPVQEEPA